MPPFKPIFIILKRVPNKEDIYYIYFDQDFINKNLMIPVNIVDYMINNDERDFANKFFVEFSVKPVLTLEELKKFCLIFDYELEYIDECLFWQVYNLYLTIYSDINNDLEHIDIREIL